MEAPWERSQGYGVDTVMINVSTANCIFNSITGINELYDFDNKNFSDSCNNKFVLSLTAIVC